VWVVGLVSVARAQVVYDDTFIGEDATFSGSDDWFTQYATDPWSTDGTTGVAATTANEGGTWGSGGPADNALVQTGETFTDMLFEAVLVTQDNDGVGVVFGFQDMRNTYLLVLADGGRVPDAGAGAPTSISGARLYAIANGTATQLGSSTRTYWQSRENLLQVYVRDDQLEVWLDDDHGGARAPQQLFQVTAPDRPEGQLGLYCYHSTACTFESVVVSVLDTDGDGVDDPDDNCLFVVDADASDPDGDGLGSGCDDDDDGDGAEDGVDCEPLDPTRFPGAQESCDGLDDDCDETPDDGLIVPWYPDVDGDGFGDEDSAPVETCAPPTGWVDVGGDCDDADDAVNPDAAEVCNGEDDDCDDLPDDGLFVTWYVDGDGDGVGAGDGEERCDDPGAGWSQEGGDCDDADDTVLAGETRFPDDDGDGFGDAAGATAFCQDPPPGWVADDTDCDDADRSVYPGAPEVPGDGIDQDCDLEDAPPGPVAGLPGDPGCGCGTGGGPGGWLAIAALVAGRRRR
jgi:hypothetical protein